MPAKVRNVVRRLQTLVPSSRSGAMILAYHLVGAETSSPVDLPVELFEAQLDSLDAPVLSLDTALAQLNRQWEDSAARSPGRGTVDRRQRSEIRGHQSANGECHAHLNGLPLITTTDQYAVLTFDDAYANFYYEVYPRLVERRLPAVLYVATGFIDGDHPVPIRGTENLAPCTWDQLREMAASGLVTLGSHTVTHPSLTHVGHNQAAWELRKSKARIEQMTGEPVRHFCYPRGLWNRHLEQLVGTHYATATIGGGGSITHPYNSLRLERTSLRREFGPDLGPIVRSRVCLEERLANVVRRWRDRFQVRELGLGS